MRGAYYAVAVLSAAAIPFLTNLLLARALPQSEYALFSMLSAIAAFVSAFALAGQPTAFTSVFFARDRRDFRVQQIKYKALNVVWGALLISFAVCVSVWQLNYKNDLSASLFWIVFTLIVAKVFFDLLGTVATCLDMYKVYAGASALAGIVVLSSLLIKPEVRTFFIAGVLAYGAGGLIMHFGVRRVLVADPRPDYPISGRSLLMIGWVAVPGMLINSGAALGERSLISRFLNEFDLATYALATTLAVNGARVLVTALLKPSLVSLLSALQAEDWPKARSVVRLINVTLLATTGLSLVFVLFAQPLFINFFGERYSPALPLLVPLFAITALEGISIVLSQPVVQKGRLGVLVGIGLLSTGLSLVSSFLLISHLGLWALVISFAFSTSFSLIANYFAALKCGSTLAFPWRAAMCVSGFGLLGLVAN